MSADELRLRELTIWAARLAYNRSAARGWNDLRRSCRVTLAQWAFIARNTRHIRNANERHAARVEAMITMSTGIWYAPPNNED